MAFQTVGVPQVGQPAPMVKPVPACLEFMDDGDPVRLVFVRTGQRSEAATYVVIADDPFDGVATSIQTLAGIYAQYGAYVTNQVAYVLGYESYHPNPEVRSFTLLRDIATSFADSLALRQPVHSLTNGGAQRLTLLSNSYTEDYRCEFAELVIMPPSKEIFAHPVDRIRIYSPQGIAVLTEHVDDPTAPATCFAKLTQLLEEHEALADHREE